MTPENTPPSSLRLQPAVRGYTILCLTALMAMVLALIENERGLMGVLLLAALGALAVIAHWRAGPALLLTGLVAAWRRRIAVSRSWYMYYMHVPGSDDAPVDGRRAVRGRAGVLGGALPAAVVGPHGLPRRFPAAAAAGGARRRPAPAFGRTAGAVGRCRCWR